MKKHAVSVQHLEKLHISSCDILNKGTRKEVELGVKSKI